MKKIEDFKKQAKEKDIKRWNIHDCSMCGYQCGYIIRDNGVFYDSGCGCSHGPLRESSFEEIAEHYNMQSNKKVIKEMDKFWGFNKGNNDSD